MATSSWLDHALTPARPALASARAATVGVTDPRAAWEALAARGIVPPAWRDDPRRRFPWFPGLAPRERAESLRRAPSVPRAHCPDDVTACALLAADVEGITRAEAAGRAFASAVRPWGAPVADIVLWVPTSWRHHGHQLHDTKPDVWEPDGFIFRIFPRARWSDVERVIARLADAPAEPGMDASRRASLARVIGVWVFAAERWAEAARKGQRAAGGAKTEGARYGDLPDPFAPALQLFEAGYALLPSGDGTLVLGYPVD